MEIMEITQKLKNVVKFVPTAVLAVTLAGAPLVTTGCGGSGGQTQPPVVQQPPPPPPVVQPPPPPPIPAEVLARPKHPPQNPYGRRDGVLLRAFEELWADPSFRAKLEALEPITMPRGMEPMTPARRAVSDAIFQTFADNFVYDTCTIDDPRTEDELRHLFTHREIMLGFNVDPRFAGGVAVFPNRNFIGYPNGIDNVSASMFLNILLHEDGHLDGKGEIETSSRVLRCRTPSFSFEDRKDQWLWPHFTNAALESGRVNGRDFKWHATESRQSLINYWNEKIPEIDLEKIEYAQTVNVCTRGSVSYCHPVSARTEQIRKAFLESMQENNIHQEFDRLGIRKAPRDDDNGFAYFYRASYAITDAIRFNPNANNSPAAIQRYHNNVEAAQLYLDINMQLARENGLRPTQTVFDDFANNTQNILRQKRIADWRAQQGINTQSLSFNEPK